MRLVIFANYFPFKKAEPFLVNEFEFSKKYFTKISLLSLYGKSGETQIQNDQTTTVLEPVFRSSNDKKWIFIKGLFNLAPCQFHLKELISLLFSYKKLYYCLVSFFVTRAILASKAYKALCSTISKEEKTLLYFYWGDNFCWIIPYLKKKFKNDQLKIVIRLHGSDLYEHLKADYAPLRKLVFQHADLIVCISNHGIDYLLQRYPDLQNKLMVSRLGVFDHGLNPYLPASSYTMVSVSNIVALKRLSLIFEVLQKTKAAINWYHFGDGPLADELRIKLKECRKDLKVQLQGHVDNQKIIHFYQTQSVDLFINLSTTEGLPVSIMEAFSFGIPVLAPNIGGIGDLVNETNGKLVSVNSAAQEISRGIEELISSSNYLDLRKNARSAFEQKVSAQVNYTDFYSRLLRL